MNFITRLFKKKKPEPPKQEEKKEYSSSLGALDQRYTEETGKSPFEFRGKMIKPTSDYYDWVNKKY